MEVLIMLMFMLNQVYDDVEKHDGEYFVWSRKLYRNTGYDAMIRSLGPIRFVVIDERRRYVDNEALLAHELHHIKQAKNWLHSLRYNLGSRYKLKSEIDGYTAQLRVIERKLQDKGMENGVIDGLVSRDIRRFSHFIANNYGLKISERERVDIVRQLEKFKDS